MGIERWAVSNTQFAPKADGMWVRHEDHEAAMGEAQERLYAEMKTGDLLAGQRDEAQARAEQANEGRTEAHAQRDKALAERDLAVGQAEAINDLIHAERARASAKVASLTARLLHYEELMVERAVKERAGAFDRAMAAEARASKEAPKACCDCRWWTGHDGHHVICGECRGWSLWEARTEWEKQLLGHVRDVDRRQKACCDCRYWGDANAHAVVCWACTSYSCWRPTT